MHTKTHKQSANYGAAQERAAIKRYIMRHQDTVTVLEILGFIQTRAERAAKRKGGLGRK